VVPTTQFFSKPRRAPHHQIGCLRRAGADARVDGLAGLGLPCRLVGVIHDL